MRPCVGDRHLRMSCWLTAGQLGSWALLEVAPARAGGQREGGVSQQLLETMEQPCNHILEAVMLELAGRHRRALTKGRSGAAATEAHGVAVSFTSTRLTQQHHECDQATESEHHDITHTLDTAAECDGTRWARAGAINAEK